MIMIIVKTVIKTNKYEKNKQTKKKHTEKKNFPPTKYSRLKPKYNVKTLTNLLVMNPVLDIITGRNIKTLQDDSKG